MSKAQGWTAGPWEACREGKCPCLQVWSTTADHPICTVESGEWGDRYPSIRFVNNSGPGSIGASVEAYQELCAYGSIDVVVGEANARLIAAAPDLYWALERLTSMAGRPMSTLPATDWERALIAARAALAKAAIRAEGDGGGK